MERERIETTGSSGAQMLGKFDAELRSKIDGWIKVELTDSNRTQGKLRGSGSIFLAAEGGSPRGRSLSLILPGVNSALLIVHHLSMRDSSGCVIVTALGCGLVGGVAFEGVRLR
jgi:hypothetical protein